MIFVLENDEFCIENDDFCIQNVEFLQAERIRRHQTRTAPTGTCRGCLLCIYTCRRLIGLSNDCVYIPALDIGLFCLQVLLTLEGCEKVLDELDSCDADYAAYLLRNRVV